MGQEVFDSLYGRHVGLLETVPDGFPPLVDVDDALGDELHVAVGVGPAVDGEPVELQFGIDDLAGFFVLRGEGQGSQADAPDGSFTVDLDAQHVRGIGALGNVGQKGRGVDKDGVPSRGSHVGDASLCQQIPEVLHLSDAMGHILLVHHLPESQGQSFEVPSCKSAVGGEALEEDHPGKKGHVGLFGAAAHHAADVYQGVLLAGYGNAVGGVHALLQDFRHAHVRAGGFPQFDEVGVFRHPGTVEVERNAVLLADLRGFPKILQAHGLTAAGIVGDGGHHQGNPVFAVGFDGLFELPDVHVALEGMGHLGAKGLVDDAVHGFPAVVEDMGPGGIEGHVEGNHVSLFEEGAENHVFRRPPLMSGNDVVEAENILYRCLEVEEAVRSRIGFIPHHKGRPLVLAHGAGAGIGEKIDVDILGAQAEHVEMPPLKGLFPLFLVGNAYGFHHFDTERFGHDAINHL